MVPPLSIEELTDAIWKPAEHHGVTFERGLVSQIVSEVEHRPGALPLLQFALYDLWEKCIVQGSPNVLTRSAYQDIEKVSGALQKKANECYENCASLDKPVVRQLLLELVQIEEGEKGKETEVLRRPRKREDLRAISTSPEQLQRVINTLADNRLIVTDDQKVELAHESLLSEWDLLKKWIEENKDNIRLKRRLESRSQEWDRIRQRSQTQQSTASPALPNSDEYLLSTGILAEFEDRVKKNQIKPSELEAEFLRLSREKDDREAQEEIKRQQREIDGLQKLVKAERQKRVVAIASVIVVAGLTVFGLHQQAETAKARFANLLSGKPVESLTPEELHNALKVAENEKDENVQIGYFRGIVKSTSKLSEEPELKSTIQKARERLERLILEVKLPKLKENYLDKKNRWGKRLIFEDVPLKLPKDLEKVFTPGESAIKETYQILTQYTGSDINENGMLDNPSESALIPCKVLGEIEKQWKSIDTSCYWLSEMGGNTRGICNLLGDSLTASVFGDKPPYTHAIDRINTCNESKSNNLLTTESES
jgi:hypothetical protein